MYPNPALLASAAEAVAVLIKSPAHNLKYCGLTALAAITRCVGARGGVQAITPVCLSFLAMFVWRGCFFWGGGLMCCCCGDQVT
jgi:hypothetical protein